MEVIKYRRGLNRAIKALKNKKLTVGFIGGSITEWCERHNWPEPVTGWLVKRYPDVRICIDNAGIGATGSELGVFRVERDLIRYGCDLVFVEFAVNDRWIETEKRMRTREGLLRKLLAAGIDVVLVYTFCQTMYKPMMENSMPDSIKEFEELAEHYNVGSVWMGLHALKEVMDGQMKWEEWLPDGLHPQSRGSMSYAASVNAYLKTELEKPVTDEEYSMPLPLNELNWQYTEFVSFDNIDTKGVWYINRWTKNGWIDHVLETAAVGSSLKLSFQGRGISLGTAFGKNSAEFKYRIDGGEWNCSNRERPEWSPEEGWLTSYTISDTLDNTEHILELEVVHGDRADCTGSNFRLGFVGIIK